MLNIAILLADVTKPEMSNILTLTWPVTSLVTPRSIKFVFLRQFFPGHSNTAWIFRIGPVVSKIRGGARNSPPPSGARYKNTPVGRGLIFSKVIWKPKSSFSSRPLHVTSGILSRGDSLSLHRGQIFPFPGRVFLRSIAQCNRHCLRYVRTHIGLGDLLPELFREPSVVARAQWNSKGLNETDPNDHN